MALSFSDLVNRRRPFVPVDPSAAAGNLALALDQQDGVARSRSQQTSPFPRVERLRQEVGDQDPAPTPSDEIRAITERLANATAAARQSRAEAAQEQANLLRNQVLFNMLGPALFGAISGGPVSLDQTQQLLSQAGDARLQEITARRDAEGQQELDEAQFALQQHELLREGRVAEAEALAAQRAGLKDLAQTENILSETEERGQETEFLRQPIDPVRAGVIEEVLPNMLPEGRELTNREFEELEDTLKEAIKARASISAAAIRERLRRSTPERVAFWNMTARELRNRAARVSEELNELKFDEQGNPRDFNNISDLGFLTMQDYQRAVRDKERELGGIIDDQNRLFADDIPEGAALELLDPSFGRTPRQQEAVVGEVVKDLPSEAEAQANVMRRENVDLGDVNEVLFKINRGDFDDDIPPRLDNFLESQGMSTADKKRAARRFWRMVVAELADEPNEGDQ